MNGRSLSSSYMLQMLAAKAPPPPPPSAPPAATTAAAAIAAVVSAAQDADSAAAAAVAAKQPAPIVQVSLAIPTLTADKLYPTPSMADHLAFDVEFDLRLVGCELIQTAGRLLQMPQTAMATAQVLFHRYFYSKSFVKNPMEYYAMACIFLSSKVQECPRRIRDIMNVFHHIKQVRTGKVIKPMPVDTAYSDLKNQIIKAERRILKELGFCVHFKHPHKIIFIYLKAMDMNHPNNPIIQKAWNYMNDSFRTDIILRYSPENIVCACIYLSARELQIPLPENPQWFSVFDADEESVRAISIRLLHMYSHVPKSLDELNKAVDNCREKLEENRRRLKQPDTSTGAGAAVVSQPQETTTIPAIPSANASETKQQITNPATLESIKRASQVIQTIELKMKNESMMAGAQAQPSPPQPSLPLQPPPPAPPSSTIPLQQKPSPIVPSMVLPSKQYPPANYGHAFPYHVAYPSHYYGNANGAVHEHYNAYMEHGLYNDNGVYEIGMKRSKSSSLIVESNEHYSHHQQHHHQQSLPPSKLIQDVKPKESRSSNVATRDENSRSKSHRKNQSRSRSRSRSRGRHYESSKDRKTNVKRHTSRSRSRSGSQSSEESDSDRYSKSHKKSRSSSHRADDKRSASKQASNSSGQPRVHDKERDYREKERRHRQPT